MVDKISPEVERLATLMKNESVDVEDLKTINDSIEKGIKEHADRFDKIAAFNNKASTATAQSFFAKDSNPLDATTNQKADVRERNIRLLKGIIEAGKQSTIEATPEATPKSQQIESEKPSPDSAETPSINPSGRGS